MAEVFNLRPFQNARNECARAKLGPNVTKAMISLICQEQREGRSGNHVAGDLAFLRMRSTSRGTEPQGAA